jgi:hypothetical protein
MSKQQLQASVQPILQFLSEQELSSEELTQALERTFPLSSLTEIRALIEQGIEEGWFAPREGHNLTYGRLIKPSDESFRFSVETVDMCATGPGHVHPNGEVDLCFALEGDPHFDGAPEGWTCYPPESWHIPTVTEGRMAILYFLPEGAIHFERRA